jgi:hypothetical protein
MLTYIVRGKDSSLFIIDEPDIYLHADLQRQLLGLLKTLGPDILIATHSTEIITEADPDDLVVINKKSKSGKRIKDPSQVQQVFQVLGSNLNPILTQLAKTKRALFVEGKDFQILSRFARKLNRSQVANRADFAVIPVEGFNPTKVRDFIQGVETTLGAKVVAGVVFDRDYRSEDECKKELASLNRYCALARIHERKELENFLLAPKPLKLAVNLRINERNKRIGTGLSFEEDMAQILTTLTDPLRHKVEARYLARRRTFEKGKAPALDDSTIDEQLMAEFDLQWKDPTFRSLLVPGKDILAELNSYLQSRYGITISQSLIIDCFTREDTPSEMKSLIEAIEEFRRMPTD